MNGSRVVVVALMLISAACTTGDSVAPSSGTTISSVGTTIPTSETPDTVPGLPAGDVTERD